MLGYLRSMVDTGELSVLLITHKFREVMAFCDEVTVLRRGRLTGSGMTSDLDPTRMAEMMMGEARVEKPVEKTQVTTRRALLTIRRSARARRQRIGSCARVRPYGVRRRNRGHRGRFGQRAARTGGSNRGSAHSNFGRDHGGWRGTPADTRGVARASLLHTAGGALAECICCCHERGGQHGAARV